MKVKIYTDRLASALEPMYGVREARSIALMAVEYFYGVTRLDMALNPDMECAPRPDAEDVWRRLVEGEPVQYVLGVARFCGMDFEVTPDVLIPRPETEELVEWVADDMRGRTPRILDIGTGSGCIAVSLARRLPQSRVRAVDISSGSLAVAARNARRNGVEVGFVLQDALAGMENWSAEITGIKYDAVVSNPPYVPHDDLPSLELHVAGYEPHSALFPPGDDPMLFYRAISRAALGLLDSGGRLYFEIYSDFVEEVCGILSDAGFADITVREDMNAKPRMVRCTKR